jgi:glycosyltransferase involved in cell wall biosynthesis
MKINYHSHKIAVVIPYYNASKHIINVVNKLPDYVLSIYIVDDCSREVLPYKELKNNNKVVFLKNEKNLGVGGAMKKGFLKAIDDEIDLIIKLDADDQMDTRFIPKLLDGLILSNADYIKGNRFKDLKALRNMPFIRKFGNLGLSFLTKVATGYWNNFDPTNGFFAIKRSSLEQVNIKNLSNRYFFETSLLSELYFTNANVIDLEMPAIYGDEKSSMNVWKMPFVFFPRLIKIFIKRILKTYFLYDFNIASIYLLFGIPMFVFGFLFGISQWYQHSINETFAPTGTIMMVTVNLILGFQLILQAIQYDIMRVDKFKTKKI